MRVLLLALSALLLSACVVAPSYQFIPGGNRVEQPGVSFVLPASKSWAAIMRSTYQAAFGAKEMPEHETLITSAMVFGLPDYDYRRRFWLW